MVAQVYLPVSDVMQHGRVRRRARDLHGNLSGHVNNPILDTRQYEVEFEDDITSDCRHVIAESMFADCDGDGNQHVLFEAIVD